MNGLDFVDHPFGLSLVVSWGQVSFTFVIWENYYHPSGTTQKYKTTALRGLSHLPMHPSNNSILVLSPNPNPFLYSRELYDAHQSAMAEDNENRKRPNKRTPTSAKKMHKVFLGDHTFVTR
jgi:hypothetical protein